MSFSLAMYILGYAAAGWSFIAIYAQYQRRVLNVIALPVILLSLAIFVWAVFYAVEIAVPNTDLKFFAHHLKFIGMVLLPVPALGFVAAYSKPSHVLTRRQIMLYVSIPVITILAIFTNPLHHLMWIRLEVVESGSLTVVYEHRNILAWVQVIYAFSVYTVILSRMLLHLRSVAPVSRYKYRMLLTAFLIPGIASLNITFQLTPIDYTPFALTLAGISVAWNLFSYRLIDLAPLASNIVTESMTDGMIVLDAHGKIFAANPAAQAILSDKDAPLLGQTYDKLLFDLMQRGIESGASAGETSGEIRTLINGETRYLELRVSTLHEDDPRPVGRVVVIRDITRRKETEGRLKAALDAEKELNALRAHFVSIVSHEFRTPMSIIQTATEMMMRYRERMTPEIFADKFATITSQIALMNALIDDVLSLDRLQSGTLKFGPEVLPIVATVHDLLEELKQDESAEPRIEFEHSDVNVDIPLDKQLIRLVIRNLVSNALKYSPNDQPVTVELSKTNGYVQLNIIDRGIGIPKEEQDRLFDAFYRAANVGDVPGSGLGLMIVKQAVDLHGGKTYFTSNPDGGTTFSVLLPLSPPASESEICAES